MKTIEIVKYEEEAVIKRPGEASWTQTISGKTRRRTATAEESRPEYSSDEHGNIYSQMNFIIFGESLARERPRYDWSSRSTFLTERSMKNNSLRERDQMKRFRREDYIMSIEKYIHMICIF